MGELWRSPSVSISELKFSEVKTAAILSVEQMKESEYFKGTNFDVKKVAVTLSHCVLMDTNCCFVAKEGDKIIGLISGYVASNFYSEDLYLREFGVWVLPEYRNKKLSMILISRWLEWGKDKNISEIWFTWMSGIDLEKADRIMSKIGFNQEGLTYKYKVNK
jgi:GNAT superfamily N-acetyltransferase